MRKILLLFTVIGPLVFAAEAQATTMSSVTLAWNPSPSSNVAGYKIYYGTSSGNYLTAVPVASVTNVTIRGLTSGTTYYFAATSYDSTGAESGFSPEISDQVGSTVITSQPANQSAVAGQPVAFSVTAAGIDLNYQWTFDENPIANATNSILTLDNVTAGQSGNYAVNVASSAGSVSSLPATLTVYPTAAASLAATAASKGQFSFTISGVSGYQYVVQASTDLVNWISLQTNVAPGSFVDPNASQFARRFYRAVYIPN